MDINEKLKKYLEVEEGVKAPLNEDPVFDLMVDLVSTLDPDSLDEEQQEYLGDILDSLGLLEETEDEDEDEENQEDEDVDEGKIMKISRKSHIGMKKDYKRNKAKLLRQAKMFRKSAGYKLWKKKHKRMVKMGKVKHKKYV